MDFGSLAFRQLLRECRKAHEQTSGMLVYFGKLTQRDEDAGNYIHVLWSPSEQSLDPNSPERLFDKLPRAIKGDVREEESCHPKRSHIKPAHSEQPDGISRTILCQDCDPRKDEVSNRALILPACIR